MAEVMITRHYTAANREDYFAVGNTEHEGNAAMTVYALPDGYSVDGSTIYDPRGNACIVVPDFGDGVPVLMSLMGTALDRRLAAA